MCEALCTLGPMARIVSPVPCIPVIEVLPGPNRALGKMTYTIHPRGSSLVDSMEMYRRRYVS